MSEKQLLSAKSNLTYYDLLISAKFKKLFEISNMMNSNLGYVQVLKIYLIQFNIITFYKKINKLNQIKIKTSKTNLEGEYHREECEIHESMECCFASRNGKQRGIGEATSAAERRGAND